MAFYACSDEEHADGTPHYHVSLKLKKPSRWGQPRKRLQGMGAVVNFSEGPAHSDGMYAWVYRYIRKLDGHCYHSEGHPSLQTITSNYARTREATNSQKAKNKKTAPQQSRASGSAPPKKLTNELVGQYCREHNIKTLDQLLADAETRRLNGDNTLNAFIFLRPSMKNVSEIVELTWRMKKAVEKVKNLATPRMDALRSAFDSSCVADCNGAWLGLPWRFCK